MTEFECKCCKYITDNKSNYNRHIKSSKHIKTTQNKPYCEICNKNYVNKGNFLRHNATYHPEKLELYKNKKEDKIDDKNIIKDNTIIDHVNIVKEQLTDEINKSNKEVIQVVNTAITRASSLIKYLMEHHKTTPPLKKIDEIKSIKLLRDKYKCPKIKNNYKLEEIFLKEYKDNIFIQNISKFILTLVNNNDKKIICTGKVSKKNVLKKQVDDSSRQKALAENFPLIAFGQEKEPQRFDNSEFKKIEKFQGADEPSLTKKINEQRDKILKGCKEVDGDLSSIVNNYLANLGESKTVVVTNTLIDALICEEFNGFKKDKYNHVCSEIIKKISSQIKKSQDQEMFLSEKVSERLMAWYNSLKEEELLLNYDSFSFVATRAYEKYYDFLSDDLS
jgi:hypothetical protein